MMINLVKNEFYKAFRLKKVYFFMAIISAIEIAFVFQYKLRGPEYISIHPNGQSLPLAIHSGLGQIMIIFIAVFLADIISDEYKSGTLKLSLMRPVGRVELLNSKIISLLGFITIMLGFAVVSSYIVGTIALGWGDKMIYQGTVYSTSRGILLTIQSVFFSLFPYLGFGMAVIFIAAVSVNIGTTIGISLGLLTISLFVEHIEYMKNYSIIHQMYFFHESFIKHFAWNALMDSIIIASYIIIFYIGSLVVLKRKDLLT